MTSQPDTGGMGGIDFAIDRGAEVPIGVQLAWALRTRIHDGRLAPGERLPGLRDLAHELKINANTVRAVYQRLEHEGMIESQQGSGTYVTANASRRSAAGAIAASVASEARQTGVDPREVAAALYVEPEREASSPSPREVARRRTLRRQIATLEQVLVRIEAEHPELVAAAHATPPPPRALPARGPRLLDEGELEQTQTHLIRRLAALQAALDARAQQSRGAPPAGAVLAPAQQPEDAAAGESAEQQQPLAPKRAARPRATRPAPAGA